MYWIDWTAHTQAGEARFKISTMFNFILQKKKKIDARRIEIAKIYLSQSQEQRYTDLSLSNSPLKELVVYYIYYLFLINNKNLIQMSVCVACDAWYESVVSANVKLTGFFSVFIF